MAKFLTQDQIQEFRECFSLYDKTRKGKISTRDLITVMRCLGTRPTPGEVERHLLHHKIEKNGDLDFSTFLTIIHQQQQQEDPGKEILDAMLMADQEKRGFIMATELRAKLTQMGEKLTNIEVDELLQEANIAPNGVVRYDKFIQTILLPPADY
ncbi:calmodulin-like protein 4 [Pristis pectinata]|uniref:calmodulin-like protein 4 n=1 Tax=Pristis pectinata TaxID=685728 RepID=UPI00223E5178|nr:calmodulin-like protein 4 [Pristis pectinata]